MQVTIYVSDYAPCPARERYRIEHQLGLKLLATGLKDIYHLSYTTGQLEAEIGKNDYGKPYLTNHPEIFFNISHTDYLAVCAFADTEIGVDTEIIGDYPAAVFRKVFTQSEIAMIESAPSTDKQQEMFARLWTLKESRIKEAGMGFSMTPTDFSFDIDLSQNPAKIQCSEKGLYFNQQILTMPAGSTNQPECDGTLNNHYMISVCATQHPVQLIFHMH